MRAIATGPDRAYFVVIMRALLSPLLLLAASAAAQDTHPPVVESGALPVAPDLLAFTDADTRMTVPVRIADNGPYRFIIDTGAQRTVISRELAAALGLPKGHDVRLTAMSGTSTEATVVIPSLAVSSSGGNSVAGGRIEAPALSGVYLGAAGLLGIDTLQGHAVIIDFDRKLMSVAPSTKRHARDDAMPGEIVVHARSLFGQLVVTDAYCAGTRVRVVLDTGSPVSMGNLALQRRFARRGRAPVPIELTSVTGGKVSAAYTQLPAVTMGALTIAALPVAFSDAAPFRQFGLADKPAILLGMDALQLFRRVEIDFANRELRLALPRDARTAPAPDGWRSVASR